MVYDTKLIKNKRRFESWSFALGMIAGCLVVWMTYVMMFRNDMDIFSMLNNSLPLSSPSPIAESITWFPQLDKEHRNVTHEESEPAIDNSSNTASVRENFVSTTDISDDQTKKEGIKLPCDAKSGDCKMNNNSQVLQEPAIIDADKQDVEPQSQRKALCELSQHRREVYVCDMEGDVRIVGKDLSTVMLVTAPGSSQTNESWQVKPYARKWDGTAAHSIRTVKVRAAVDEEAPQCSVSHSDPGIVFASGGYCGNIFHDFADMLIPLFLTARGFDGKVQFVVANNQSWWFYKYHHILQKLSSYELINYDNDDRVHCFKHVIVGLRADKDLMIDSSKSPQGLSMVDFTKFLRSSYSLQRDHPWTAGEQPAGRRPRLLFIARGRSRKFVNLEEIIPMAEEVGYEVVMAEPSFMDVASFASTVNSCDVMVGVHGAGLTNMIFLPTNAILIQVVPLAKLDWIAANYYAEPAKGMKLRYLQYDIREEESSLIDMYPRDHPVFKDPDSLHKQGWKKMGAVYLGQQNVRLDTKRFRPVLEMALQLLKEKAEHTV